MLAAGVVLIPYAPTKALFFSAGGIIGFASGGYDTSQVVWTLELWHGEAGVYIQAEYFAFALGTFVAPILTKPFLNEEHTCLKLTGNCTINSTIHVQDKLGVREETELHIPALASGAIVVAAAAVMLGLFCFKRYEPPALIRKSSFNFSHSEQQYLLQDTTASLTRRGQLKRLAIISLCAAFLGCYQGMEVCTLQFIPTFSHYVGLRLSEADGAAVLSAVTGAFTVGRFLGILACVFNAKPVGILIANLIVALAGNVVLLLAANTNLYALYAGGVLLGLGYSTVFACVYDYIERHVRVTNLVSAVMVVSGSIVGAIYPLVVGNSVEQRPFVLMETIFFSLGMCAITFFGIYALTCGDGVESSTVPTVHPSENEGGESNSGIINEG